MVRSQTRLVERSRGGGIDGGIWEYRFENIECNRMIKSDFRVPPPLPSPSENPLRHCPVGTVRRHCGGSRPASAALRTSGPNAVSTTLLRSGWHDSSCPPSTAKLCPVTNAL